MHNKRINIPNVGFLTESRDELRYDLVPIDKKEVIDVAKSFDDLIYNVLDGHVNTDEWINWWTFKPSGEYFGKIKSREIAVVNKTLAVI